MKKTYKQLQMFITLMCLVAFKVGAQPLTGTVTIDQGSPASATNFQSFTSLAATVNTAGISGGLEVIVVANSGPYNEQPAFTNVAGTSPSSRLIIRGNGNTLSFNSSSSAAPYTLLLNGTKYMAVDNLMIVGLGTTYAEVCILTNQADYNNFTACSFSCNVNGTSSYQIPFLFNSSTGLPTSGGNAGNFNTITTSTLSGGYYSIWHYGLSAAPFTRGNTFEGCVITDWYYYCAYAYYAKDLTVKNCDFSRPMRTTHTSTNYFWYGWYSQGNMLDGNVFHDFWATNTSYSGTMYGFYYWGYNPADYGNRNTFRNNIIRDMKWLGTTYMFYYNYSASNDYINNTFSYDHLPSTGTTYIFYYCYASGLGANKWLNNNFSITKGGTNYGLFFAGNQSGSIVNYNNYHVTGTTNFIGNWATAANTFTAWQAQGPDANGTAFNPNYANLATGDLHPTNVAMDNLASPLGVTFDQSMAIRNQNTPDQGALEFNTPLCTGAPNVSSLVGGNYLLCPGQSASLAVGSNALSNLAPSGITMQWQSSTISGVGPWTPVSGATGLNYVTPSTYSLTYYSLALTCTNAGGGVSTPVATLNIAAPTTSVAPYKEDFEGIAINNRLPNCSWTSPSLGAIAKSSVVAASGNRIPRSGTSYAYFDNSAGIGTSYYYTNGINLTQGITYSVSTWYRSDLTGAVNWTDMSILLGTAQATSGLVSLASTNGPAVSPVYAPLSNTFQVSSTGLYYVAVRATSQSGAATYLTWDDLVIEIPCQIAGNSPTVTIGTAQGVICTGGSAVLSAGGANSYTWSTGATTSSITVSPGSTQVYTVQGKSNVTQCISGVAKTITVNVAPQVAVFASPPQVCAGSPCNLLTSNTSGVPAVYAWSNGQAGANIVVSPNATTSYTVIATSANGCSSQNAITVGVNPLPSINIGVSNNAPCVNDGLTLVGTPPNLNYTWVSSTSSSLLQGSNVNTTAGVVTGLVTFTATGTDAKGCSSFTTTNLTVNACTGINETNLNNTVRIFPNPSAGVFTVEFASTNNNSVEVTDVTGRLISKSTSETSKVEINISNMAAGVYYVKANNADTHNVYKIVKE